MPKFELAPNTILINPDNRAERYIITRKISEGGFSFIYEADMVLYSVSRYIEEQEISRKTVVIKELFYPEKAQRTKGETWVVWTDENERTPISKKIKEKTLGEAMKLSVLKNEHILNVITALDLNNTVYIVTEKIENARDFSKILEEENLSVESAKKYIKQICTALQEVHRQNIIHLDIKPENILLDANDRAVLIDFGISVSVKDGKTPTVLGAETPHYSPPEQATKKNLSFATDIYALGCTFYTFLTKKKVPHYTDIMMGTENVVVPSYYNREVSSYLDFVILKAISIPIIDRYQTINDFLAAIDGEEDYYTLINKARDAFRKGLNEEAIQYITASEKYIQYTEEVENLLFDIRNDDSQQQNRKIQEAEQFIRNKNYALALDIYKSLPQNADIEQRIVQIEEEIKKEKCNTLRQEASEFENQGEVGKAIEVYQELKILEPHNKKIQEKIDELLNEENYKTFISKAEIEEEKNDFAEALHYYFTAQKYKNTPFVQKKIEELKAVLNSIEERSETVKIIENQIDDKLPEQTEIIYQPPRAKTKIQTPVKNKQKSYLWIWGIALIIVGGFVYTMVFPAKQETVVTAATAEAKAEAPKSVVEKRFESALPEYYAYFLYTGKVDENGKPSDSAGVGVYYDPSKELMCTYTGGYQNGVRNGKGIMEYNTQYSKNKSKDPQTLWEGTMKNDFPTGEAKVTLKSGACYTGIHDEKEKWNMKDETIKKCLLKK